MPALSNVVSSAGTTTGRLSASLRAGMTTDNSPGIPASAQSCFDKSIAITSPLQSSMSVAA